MKKLCIWALVLVLTLSVFTGCGCTNRRGPAGMDPTGMTTVPTTEAATKPTTAPTTTPTEEMTIPTIDNTEATADMIPDNTSAAETTDSTGDPAATDATDTTAPTGSARHRTIR